MSTIDRAAIKRAVEILGSQQRLADACGVRQTAVSAWLTRTKKMPLETAMKIRAATGGKVKIQDIDASLPEVTA